MFHPRTRAAAKVNLTLAVLAKRADGYHDLSSLVAFAEAGDELALTPGADIDLVVSGEAAAAVASADNLVLKAANALRSRVDNLKLGRFELTKTLPAGAGLGGGSADAAAALRLLASLNDLDPTDARILEAARATGADVTVCLESKARLMHGVGDVLSPPIALPALDAVLAFPAAPTATRDVFQHFTLVAGPRRKTPYAVSEIPTEREALLSFLKREANDLELAARLVTPEISDAKQLLEDSGAQLVRMTGSGSAVFALYEHARVAQRAAAKVKKRRPGWWAVQTMLG